MLLINGAFRRQRITGQQRYATEISAALAEAAREIRPPQSYGLHLTWLWSQLMPLWAGRSDWLLSLTSRAPIVHPKHILVIHDLFVLTNPEWFSWRYRLTHVPLLRAQMLVARAFVCVSPATAQELRMYVSPRKRVVIAANAPTSAPTREPAEPVRGLEGRVFLLAVGSKDPRKNLSRLVEAFGRLTQEERGNALLVLVGGVSRNFAHNQFEKSASIIDLDYVSDSNLRWLYANAHALVVPSYAEGFGLPVVEGLAAGCPVVLSDIPVFRWIAADAGLYFNPTSAMSITQALSRALRTERDVLAPDSATRNRLGAQFSWSNSAAVIRDLASELGAI